VEYISEATEVAVVKKKKPIKFLAEKNICSL